ncbi:MAG TPA: DUF480 domain-containing protein [Solirubrobacteraceae bacterium]|nr:DUF480 domain-containing protein [Solirubrobacteraceae bacterium]
MDLSATEARVLGCMMEKQLTTPDIYPLTLNSLRLACNQSTNRDPVVSYDDAILRDALHRLERRGYARLASGRGSRAPKYRHLLAEALPLSGDEHAVLCVLLLRGGQTPGELKQRAERMHGFDGLDAVHDALERLIARGLVARLARRPGQKEERYEHLLSADAEDQQQGARAASAASGPGPAAPASASGVVPAPAPAGASGLASTAAPAGTPGVEPSAGAPTVGISPFAPPGASAAGAATDKRVSDRWGSGGDEAAMPDAGHATGGVAGLSSLAALEARIARLEREVAELRRRTDSASLT